jgi:DUF4097 and DUF4098 domain-containing protein YvlB
MADDAETTRLHVSSRSGRVRIRATAGASLEVEGGKVEHHPDGVVRITGSKLGSQKVEVRCPAGCDVIVGTESGAVETRGELRDVRVTTRSGKITIEHARDVDVRTSSGTVEVGECTGTCRVVTKSSNVRVDRADQLECSSASGRVDVGQVRDAVVRTMSGRVWVATDAAGRVEVRTLSGTVEIEVPAGARPMTHLKSLSGHVHCDCEAGTDGELHVATTSGAIKVSAT